MLNKISHLSSFKQFPSKIICVLLLLQKVSSAKDWCGVELMTFWIVMGWNGIDDIPGLDWLSLICDMQTLSGGASCLAATGAAIHHWGKASCKEHFV